MKLKFSLSSGGVGVAIDKSDNNAFILEVTSTYFDKVLSNGIFDTKIEEPYVINDLLLT
jgi:hypothetical protein